MDDSTGLTHPPQEGHRAAGAGAAQRVDVLERRLAQKREELAGLEHQIVGLEQDLHRWRTGLTGERLVGALLDGLLDDGWVALHDLHWPGRSRANLDHVLVGPGGVVVIDTKNWAAPVAVRLDGVLQVGGTPRSTASRSAAAMTAAVAAVLPPPYRTTAAGVLCFAGQSLVPETTREGVVVLGEAHLVGWVRGLQAWLAPDEVLEIADHLRRELGGPESPELLTTAVASPTAEASRRGRAPEAARLSARPSARSATGQRAASTRPRGRRAAPKPASRSATKGLRRLVLLAAAVATLVGASSWTNALGPLVSP